MEALIDKIYSDLTYKFKDRFFPIKISLIDSDIYISLFHGWIERLSRDELNWLNEYVQKIRFENKVAIAYGRDFKYGYEKYVRQNNDYPSSGADHKKFSPNPYPENSDFFETKFL